MTSQPNQQYQTLLKQAQTNLNQANAKYSVTIQVGSATCENAAGADKVYKEFTNLLKASGRSDIALRRTGCTGRCSCEPIVTILKADSMPVKYQQVDPDWVPDLFESHILKEQPLTERLLETEESALPKYEFLFCGAENCAADKSEDLCSIFKNKLTQARITDTQATVIQANCFGLCKRDQVKNATHILVRPSKVLYRVCSTDDLDRIIDQHIGQGKIVQSLCISDAPMSQNFFDLYGDVAFFNRQSRVALRNSGVVDPESLEEYLTHNGYKALATALDKNDPQTIIDTITQSKLRGRGGGGFPTGIKWQNARQQNEPEKFIICNADEGDPGAFMDRSMLEGDPFSIIEGMTIGAFAIGASHGFLYIRAEYPMAIQRIQNAIELAREQNLLGDNILGSSFNFDLEIRLGAGAFVCGEETALIHSIEGQRGQPSIRPPFPAQSGLWGKPTIINNVETWANIPVILNYGPQWFHQIGTENSGGTKVFALAGKVNHTGLVEVPMGTTLREIVFDIGGGIADGKKLKAIQTGGPAGGCLPAKWLDTKVDFDTLQKAGSIMGSGGMIVMDEDDCMVDIALFFLQFSQSESCGKCTPCREGTKRMLEILERITQGKGEMEDLDKLHRLASLVKKSSLCGLGRAAPNPVLSTLDHFHDEYIAHVRDKTCPARKCTHLIRYEIDPDKCVGCTACARNCPVDCIDGKAKQPHVINQDRCIKCGRCYKVCRFDAVVRT